MRGRRKAYAQNKLVSHRIRALEAIPGWSWVALRKLQSTVSAGHPNLSWCAQEGKDPWLCLLYTSPSPRD